MVTEFKEGQRVLVTGEGNRDGWNWEGMMEPYIGKVGEIAEDRHPSENSVLVKFDDGRRWVYRAENLSPYNPLPKELFEI